MTVEELIEELKQMPPTAMVFVLADVADRSPEYELLDTPIESIVYDLGHVSIRLEE